MCFLFHKWGKWGDTTEEEWTKAYILNGIRISEKIDFIRISQVRICERCGKVQRRYLDTN